MASHRTRPADIRLYICLLQAYYRENETTNRLPHTSWSRIDRPTPLITSLVGLRHASMGFGIYAIPLHMRLTKPLYGLISYA